MNAIYNSTTQRLAEDPTATLNQYGYGDDMIEVVEGSDYITVHTNGGEMYCGTAQGWADHVFLQIEATRQAAERFDATGGGKLYKKITGITMYENIGAATLP